LIEKKKGMEKRVQKSVFLAQKRKVFAGPSRGEKKRAGLIAPPPGKEKEKRAWRGIKGETNGHRPPFAREKKRGFRGITSRGKSVEVCEEKKGAGSPV